MTIENRLRLDTLIAERGLSPSRSRARDAIQRGTVRVDGRCITKPGQMVLQSAKVEIEDPADGYVSRAALKLGPALEHFNLSPAGCDCLDVGASTGGFTQVLLEHRARSVIAIDVGHGQLHESLRLDRRVTALEGVNARHLDSAMIGGLEPGFIVCDVSFISLKLALPPALRLASMGAGAVLLVKPQFEIGRRGLGKGGIVRDAAEGLRVAESLLEWLGEQPGWRSVGMIDSPIEGSDGNREYVIAGRKDAAT